jgi:hypothetical protein
MAVTLVDASSWNSKPNETPRYRLDLDQFPAPVPWSAGMQCTGLAKVLYPADNLDEILNTRKKEYNEYMPGPREDGTQLVLDNLLSLVARGGLAIRSPFPRWRG